MHIHTADSPSLSNIEDDMNFFALNKGKTIWSCHLLKWGKIGEQVWGREDQEFSFKNINFKMFIRHPSDNHATV